MQFKDLEWKDVISDGVIVCSHCKINLCGVIEVTSAPSQIMQYLKGRSSKLLQDDFPELRKKYWGQHMWGRGYFCGTVGAVDE